MGKKHGAFRYISNDRMHQAQLAKGLSSVWELGSLVQSRSEAPRGHARPDSDPDRTEISSTDIAGKVGPKTLPDIWITSCGAESFQSL